MEELLRGAQAAEIIPFDYSAPCLYVPVRHHSPACAYHLRLAVERYRPDCILVEGPENANPLLPVLADPESRPPLALYYAFRDKEGVLSEEKESYKCYYPFLACSPEYIALREAAERGIPCRFIDLPYGEILLATEEGRGLRSRAERHAYNDDSFISRSRFVSLLCEKTGLRSFEEFWEKYFEIRGLSLSTEDFVAQLHTYCLSVRRETPTEQLVREGCLAREAHMARRIAEARETYGRVLVVTGGFHTWGLLHPEPWEFSRSLPQKDQSVYPIRYSMEAADALRGYESGMPCPGYYDAVWRVIQSKEPELPYEKANLDVLVSVGRAMRREGFSLAASDEICAVEMARGLAQLRGKEQPGLYELQDAVLSCFVKGEATRDAMPLRALRRFLTGDQLGKLCRQELVPPLVQDFDALCRKFRIRLEGAASHQVVWNLFSSPRHREASRFFHQTVFLDCGFAQRVKGPDLLHGKDRNLIRETWEYKWSGQVAAALVDHSVSGSTMEEACRTELRQRMAAASSAGEGAALLVQRFLMGIGEESDGGNSSAPHASGFSPAEKMETLLASDGDFFSLAKACSHLHTLWEMQELYRQREGDWLPRLLDVCFWKLAQLLPSVASVKEDRLDDCIRICALLYRLSAGEPFAGRRPLLLEALRLLTEAPDINPGLHGAALGLLYGAQPEWKEEILRVSAGYLRGTRDKMLCSAVFLRGLFSTSRDLVLLGGDFITMLDDLFACLEQEDFSSLLPELRLAFRYFTPNETQRIAKQAAALHGKQPAALLTGSMVTAAQYARGEQIDEWAAAQLGREEEA